MKKLVLMIILTIITSFFISFSYSIYRSNAGASATVTGATWSVSTSGNNETINLTSGTTEQEYTLTVNNNSEVDVTYSIILTDLPSGLKVKVDSGEYVEEENSEIRFNNVGNLIVGGTTTRNHTLTFSSILDSEEVTNEEININVEFKQKLN